TTKEPTKPSRRSSAETSNADTTPQPHAEPAAHFARSALAFSRRGANRQIRALAPQGECSRLTGITEPDPERGAGGPGHGRTSALAAHVPVDEPSDAPGHGTDECAADDAGSRGEEAHDEV